MPSQPPKAFTLLELLVVLVIMGVLASVLLPICYQGIHKVRSEHIRLELMEYASALKRYHTHYGQFPDFLEHSIGSVVMEDHIDQFQSMLGGHGADTALNPQGLVFMVWNKRDYDTLCDKLSALYNNKTLLVEKKPSPNTLCIYPAADPSNGVIF